MIDRICWSKKAEVSALDLYKAFDVIKQIPPLLIQQILSMLIIDYSLPVVFFIFSPYEMIRLLQ